MNIFEEGSPFQQFLNKVADLLILNLVTLLTCLPIITIGASTTALYACTLKIADGIDGEITKRFFSSFRQNFAQATRVWLILLAAGLLIGADTYIAVHLRSSSTGVPAVFWTLNLALLFVIGIVYVIILLYIFPLISKFSNTDFNMFKNSLLIGIRYLFCTIMLFAVHFAMFFLVVAVFTPLIIFGEGLCALLCSYLMINVMRIVAYHADEEQA